MLIRRCFTVQNTIHITWHYCKHCTTDIQSSRHPDIHTDILAPEVQAQGSRPKAPPAPQRLKHVGDVNRMIDSGRILWSANELVSRDSFHVPVSHCACLSLIYVWYHTVSFKLHAYAYALHRSNPPQCHVSPQCEWGIGTWHAGLCVNTWYKVASCLLEAGRSTLIITVAWDILQNIIKYDSPISAVIEGACSSHSSCIKSRYASCEPPDWSPPVVTH